MRYIVEPRFYLYNLLTNGDSYESLVEQQLFLAENGIDWQTSENWFDFEREVAVSLLVKKKKEEIEQKNLEWQVFCRLFS